MLYMYIVKRPSERAICCAAAVDIRDWRAGRRQEQTSESQCCTANDDDDDDVIVFADALKL